MALDYSNRTQVSRNRPKKRSTKPFLLIIFFALSGVYLLGLGTGWLLFNGKGQKAPSVAASGASEPDGKQKNAEKQRTPAKDSVTSAKKSETAETPLTFYYTLPKGDKGVIGSGVNLSPEDKAPLTKKDVPTQATVAGTMVRNKSGQKAGGTTPGAQAGSEQARDKKPPAPVKKDKAEVSVPAPKNEEKGKAVYSVQAGSYQDKDDAQELKTSLEQNGFSARVSEHKVPGKDVMYRVRVGRKMEREEAKKLAAKVGRGAIPVPE